MSTDQWADEHPNPMLGPAKTTSERTRPPMSMSTVGELLDYLATQPRDRKVILRKDAEGNGHSPLADAWEGMYAADSTWSGETYITPEDLAAILAGPNPNGYSDEDAAPDDAERVVVLGPVN